MNGEIHDIKNYRILYTKTKTYCVYEIGKKV